MHFRPISDQNILDEGYNITYLYNTVYTYSAPFPYMAQSAYKVIITKYWWMVLELNFHQSCVKVLAL